MLNKDLIVDIVRYEEPLLQAEHSPADTKKMIFGGNEFSKTDEDYQYPLQYLLYRSGYTI